MLCNATLVNFTVLDLPVVIVETFGHDVNSKDKRAKDVYVAIVQPSARLLSLIPS